MGDKCFQIVFDMEGGKTWKKKFLRTVFLRKLCWEQKWSWGAVVMDTKDKTDAPSTGNECFQLIVFYYVFVDIYSWLYSSLFVIEFGYLAMQWREEASADK